MIWCTLKLRKLLAYYIICPNIYERIVIITFINHFSFQILMISFPKINQVKEADVFLVWFQMVSHICWFLYYCFLNNHKFWNLILPTYRLNKWSIFGILSHFSSNKYFLSLDKKSFDAKCRYQVSLKTILVHGKSCLNQSNERSLNQILVSLNSM